VGLSAPALCGSGGTIVKVEYPACYCLLTRTEKVQEFFGDFTGDGRESPGACGKSEIARHRLKPLAAV